MRQVFATLLDNALKYTSKDSAVDIEAFITQEQIKITVKDTGIGIKSDDIQFIWDRLYRGEDSGCRPGMGLGLSYVKAIVQIHGSRAEVSSERVKGTIFSIVLAKNSLSPVQS
jgi:signal transduction histidine kinase